METRHHALVALGCCLAVLVAPGLAADRTPGDEETATPVAASALALPRAVVRDGLAVGDQLDPATLHEITRPGLYGLTRSGSDRFGVVGDKLLRYDPTTLQLKAIIRSNVTPLD